MTRNDLNKAGWNRDEMATAAELKNEIAENKKVDAEIKAAVEESKNEWTLEVTRARRAEWNEWVSTHSAEIAADKEGAIRAREAEQGWAMIDLVHAVRDHGIK